MGNNDFMLDIIAVLNKRLSKAQLKSDLKGIDNTLSVKVIAKLATALSKKQLGDSLKQLNNLYVQVGTKFKTDKDTRNKLLNEIEQLQKNLTELQLKVNVEKGASQNAIGSVISAAKTAQKYTDKTSITLDVEVRKEKAVNDILYIGQKYSELFSNVSASQKYENLLNSAYSISDKSQLQEVRAQISAFTSELKANGLATESTGQKWRKLIDRAKELFSAASVIRTIFVQAKQAVSTTIGLDKVYTDLVKVNDELNRNDYADYLSRCNQKAQELATTQKALIEGATEFSKSGYNLSISDALTEKSTILSNVGDMGAADSAKAIISGIQAYDAVDGYTDVVDKAQALIDKYNEIGNTASITTAEIAIGVQKVGSVFADSNTSVDEFIALLSAGNRQFQDADNLSLGLRTAALRIRGCTSELEMMNEETEGVYTSASKLAEKIEGLTNVNGTGGVKILEADGETFRSIYDIFLDISKVYKDMSDTDASALLELIAGKNRASAISATLNNMSEAEEILQNSLNAAGSAQKEYDIYLESTEAHIQQFQAKLVETYSTFMNVDMISHTADLGTAVLDLVNKTDLLKHSLIAIAALKIGQGISAVGGAIAGTVTQMNTLGNAIQQIKSLPLENMLKTKPLIEIGEVTQNLTEKNLRLLLSQEKLTMQDKVLILQQHNLTEEEAKSKLEKMGLTAATNANTAANTANATSANTLKGAFTGLTASIKATWAAMSMLQKASIIFAAISTAWSIGSSIINGIKQSNEELVQSTQEAANTYRESASSIEDYASRHEELHKALIAAKGNEEEIYNIKQQLLALQTELNDKFGEECGTIDLVTNAYESQAEVIRNLNKEKAQLFLNENKAGIDKAEKEMTKDRHYNLSLTGISAYTDEGAALKEIAEKYKDQGITVLDELGDGSYAQFSVHLKADAQSAYDTINAFENDLRGKAKEFGDEHMFDDVLDMSSGSLNQAKETIDKYGDIFQQALIAEIALDDVKTKTYDEALNAVEAYNEAILKSKNPYDDQDVAKAKETLDMVKASIQDNEAEWGKYSTLFDDVFGQADTRLIEFNEELKDNSGLQELAKDLEGLSDLDLQALDENVGENKSFDNLKEAAAGYKVNVNELIDALVRLGYVQGEAPNLLQDNGETAAFSISQTINQLNTRLKPTFDSLKSAYQNIFTDSGFTLENIDLSMLDSIKSKLDELNGLEGANISIDYSSFDNLVRVLTDSSSKSWEVQKAFDSFATSVLNSTDVMDSMDESTVQLVASMLESMGVANANEVAYEAFNAKMEGLALQEQLLAETGKELANVTADDAAAFLKHAGASDIARTYLFQLVAAEQVFNAQGLDVNGKIEKLKELATAYGQSAIAAKIAHMEDQNAKAHTSFTDSDYQMLIDEVNNAVNNVQIDFQGVGGGFKSAGTAGKETADTYLEAFEKELKDLDDLKSDGKISEKQYLDALRRLYLKYFRDKEKYLKEYEKYEHQYLEGMKSLYESAFSYITKQIDKRIDAVNSQKDAAISALEAERDARLEAIEAQKEQYEHEIEGIEAQIDAREKEIKAMQDANGERKRAIDLQKAEYELQRMQNQKTSFVYKDGQMVYEADTSGIRDAKQEVEDAKLEIDISKIEKEIDRLEEEKNLLQERIDLLDKEAEQVNQYYDQLIAQTEKHYDAMVKGLEDYKSQFEELTDLLENAQLEASLSELGINMDALLSGSQEEFEKLKTAYIGILADMSRGNDGVLEQLSRLSGISTESISYLNATKGALEELGNVTLEGLEESIGGIGESASTLSTSAGEASAAAGSIQESVRNMSQSIAPLNTELGNLKTLIGELIALLNDITFPEIGEEGYAQKLMDMAQAFGEIASKCGEFKNIDFSSIIGSASAPSTDGAAMPGGEGMEGAAGTGFLGLASAISEAVSSIDEQMGKLKTALDSGNSYFTGQIDVINEKYIPAWENLRTRLAEIIGVEGGDSEDKEGRGKQKAGSTDGGSASDGKPGSIIDIMQTGGDAVDAKLEDPWLKAFNDFATDGDNSIQTICDKIIDLVTKMAEIIQAKCEAAASALHSLAKTAESSLSAAGGSVSGNTVSGNPILVSPHAKGTASHAFAEGTGKYKGLAHDEKYALRSEYGQPELTVYPDGTAELTTEPVLGSLPKGTVIFNEEQTKHIMNNEGEIVGKAYDEGTIRLADGTEIRPLNPGDKEYWMAKKFDEYFRENRDVFLRPTNAMFKVAESMDRVIETINNTSNYHQIQNNTYNVSLPNVTNESTAAQLMRELRELPRETYQYINRR